MFAICQTYVKKDDVRTNVNQMIKTGYRGRIIQTGDVKCPSLEKAQETNPQKIWELINARKNNRKVDVPKRTLHRVNCEKCGADSVDASILDDKATRLKLCACIG